LEEKLLYKLIFATPASAVIVSIPVAARPSA